jgi:cytochrome d ubiquinol oxidase subunit I
MNQPTGFTLRHGRVVDVDPLAVIFNRAFPYETVHMLVAAYLVGGFLIASVYAVGLLRGRNDRYHRLGFLIPFTIAAVAAPVQLAVGDWAARSVYHDDPAKFAAIELVPRTRTHVPETIGGFLDARGRVQLGVRLPDVASLLSGYSPATRIRGLLRFPARDRTTPAQATVVHLAWDAMVGIGTALAALAAWFALAWWRRRDLPTTRWFLRAAAVAGGASIAALEAGWVVTEVGRQPWIVHGAMRVPAGATTNGGVWLTFVVVAAVYLIVAVATIAVIRTMRRKVEP